MKAMIFAAGLGLRLKPLTNNKPKALVEVVDKTLLELVIARLIKFGINDIVINTHHFSQQLKTYLAQNNNFNVNIKISDETNLLLDTGGGLKKAAALLEGKQPVLLQNVDIISDIDYNAMLNQHIKENSLATLAVQNRPSSRLLMFNKHNQLSGWENIHTGEKIITRKNYTSSVAFCGVHIISPKLLKLLPNKNVFSIIEAYLELSKQYNIAGYIHKNKYWFDVGNPEKLIECEKYLKKTS